MTTIEQAIVKASQSLELISESPRLDAQLLLMEVMNCTRTYLFTWPDKTLTNPQLNAFAHLVDQRNLGRPIAHLIGHKEFWGLPIKVSLDTLIPRPDTEILVEQALKLIAQPSSNARVLDLGTGTGAIALAIASERPYCQITAVELSFQALETAKENGLTLCANIEWVHGSWFSPFTSDSRFDMIVSNPPYIEDNDPHLRQGDVRFEPLTALTSGPDGLNDIREICEQAPKFLRYGGSLLIEHGYNQAQAVQQIFKQNGFDGVHTVQDLGGNDRVTIGILRTSESLPDNTLENE